MHFFGRPKAARKETGRDPLYASSQTRRFSRVSACHEIKTIPNGFCGECLNRGAVEFELFTQALSAFRHSRNDQFNGAAAMFDCPETCRPRYGFTLTGLHEQRVSGQSERSEGWLVSNPSSTRDNFGQKLSQVRPHDHPETHSHNSPPSRRLLAGLTVQWTRDRFPNRTSGKIHHSRHRAGRLGSDDAAS